MVSDKELISKLQELRQIKPEKEWAFLTKTRILGQDLEKESLLLPTFRFLFQPKLAYAGLAFVFVLVGLFGFSQNSVPGDSLYSLKKIIEKSQAVFVSEQKRPQASLELANKRLEELTKVAETNQVKKLAPAINEFQASVSEVAKNFSKTEGISQDAATIKKIVALEKNIQSAEQILGTQIGTGELDSIYKNAAENVILTLEISSLTEEKEEVLNQMKELAEQEKYLEVLELLPLINQ